MRVRGPKPGSIQSRGLTPGTRRMRFAGALGAGSGVPTSLRMPSISIVILLHRLLEHAANRCVRDTEDVPGNPLHPARLGHCRSPEPPGSLRTLNSKRPVRVGAVRFDTPVFPSPGGNSWAAFVRT